MWYIKTFLVFVVIIVVVLFGLANRGQVVTLRWWSFSETGTQIDVVAALFVAYAAGALSLFVVGIVRELRVRARLTRLERERERMRRELNALRTAPLLGPGSAPRPSRPEPPAAGTIEAHGQ